MEKAARRHKKGWTNYEEERGTTGHFLGCLEKKRTKKCAFLVT